MQQTLLRIPIDAGIPLGSFSLPLFGWGLLLALWCVYGLWQLRVFWKQKTAETTWPVGSILLWAVVAGVMVYAPTWAQSGFRKEIARLDAALKRQPRGAQAAANYLQRGTQKRQLREYDAAIADYRASLDNAIYPLEPQLALAWILSAAPAEDVRKPAEAVQIVDELLQSLQQSVNPGALPRALIYDTAAIAYASAGKFAEAQEFSRQAARVTYYSEDRNITSRMGDIRERLELFLAEQPYRDPVISPHWPQSLPVFGYGFLVFLGFISAAGLASHLAKKVGVQPQAIWDIGVWGLVAGISGARIFYMVQYSERVFGGKSGKDLLLAPFQLSDGGLVLLGGVLTGGIAAMFLAKAKKVKPLLLLDMAIPAFFLALAFGRLGCLMNGCCYGDRCDLPWAIQFPLGSVPDLALVNRGFVDPAEPWPWGIHPSQIYSSINALVLCALTLTYFRFRKTDGSVLALGWMLYPISRFLIEFLRGDEMGKFGTGFTISQLVSAGLFTSGVLFAVWLRNRPNALTPILLEPRPR